MDFCVWTDLTWIYIVWYINILKEKIRDPSLGKSYDLNK